ncbi:hypothetical protein FHL15_007458 [Xylaria flabelliformis]|uniref:DUF6594 domain-containing protein n=1 Tax=Xylaria flabelliformis TaxID=2512241 RepID=A0A553HUP7_9PEZI|nr:hypothetical protein FHL15_007458 [Xylaria flabelliformis]
MEEPLPEEIQRQPWKYVGYRRYAEFISSDSDMLIFRRFGELNARVGLLLQDKCSLLEQKLIDLDKKNSRRDADPINNGTIRDDIEERETLLNEIAHHLDRYSKYTDAPVHLYSSLTVSVDKFLIQQSQLREYARAPSRDVKSLRTWHANHQNMAIDEEEHRYLEQHQDLIRLRSNNKTPVRNWIDNSLALRTLRIWKKQSRTIPKYEANNISYYSNTSIDAFASGTIIFIGAFLLITPIWILQAIEDLQIKLAVITTFVLVFLFVLSFAMASKPFEALGATAAYAAVLMVFIQVGL